VVVVLRFWPSLPAGLPKSWTVAAVTVSDNGNLLSFGQILLEGFGNLAPEYDFKKSCLVFPLFSDLALFIHRQGKFGNCFSVGGIFEVRIPG